MKLETIKELHRHHAGIVAALRKEIEEVERDAAPRDSEATDDGSKLYANFRRDVIRSK